MPNYTRVKVELQGEFRCMGIYSGVYNHLDTGVGEVGKPRQRQWGKLGHNRKGNSLYARLFISGKLDKQTDP